MTGFSDLAVNIDHNLENVFLFTNEIIGPEYRLNTKEGHAPPSCRVSLLPLAFFATVWCNGQT